MNRHTPSLAPLLDTLRAAAPFTSLTKQLAKSDASLIHVPHAAKAQLGAALAADRRIVWHPQAMRDLTQGRAPSGMGAAAPAPTPAADPEVVRVALQEVIDTWWNDEPEDLREDLREELQNSRGLPQELDRHLLLRVRKVLDRTLSFNEKKTLRDLVRTKVLGVTAEE